MSTGAARTGRGTTRATVPSLAILVLLAAPFVVIPSAAGAQSWSDEKIRQVDDLIDHFRQTNSDGATLPTLSIAIGVDGHLTLGKGYGASDGKPVTDHTLYEVGSLTKQFTAAAVLELIRDGATTVDTHKKLTLETPLSDIFGKDSYWAEQPWLTVGRLLTMTSNLPNFTRWPPNDANPFAPISAEHLFADIESSAPSPASSEFDYSNTNYFLLAELLERTVLPGEKQPETYHEFLTAHLLQPAGMRTTEFIGEQPDGLDPPDPYAQRSQQVSTASIEEGAAMASPDYRGRRRPPFTNPDWLKGSGDMVSSAADMFAWHKALMGGQVVPAEVRDRMFADASRVTPFIYYGMGWFCEHKDDRDVFSHSGAVPGFTSYTSIIRMKTGGRWISVTLLSNSDQLDGLDGLADDIVNIVLQ
ncbi:MAG TPA: serine hydrolase domain-containing protein [Methylovirgula sp.]|nr:serine hydrolase domain-containing protein [Methylovirgula sp.]